MSGHARHAAIATVCDRLAAILLFKARIQRNFVDADLIAGCPLYKLCILLASKYVYTLWTGKKVFSSMVKALIPRRRTGESD